MNDFIGTRILGARQRGLGRARRVRRFLLVSTALMAALTGTWALFAWHADHTALLWADLILMCVSLLALTLARYRQLVLAIHFLLVALMLWICGVAWFISGSGANHDGAVHFWLLVVIVALHFVLFDAGRVVQTVYSASAILMFVVIEYELIDLAPKYGFPEAERIFSHGLTVGLVLIAIVLVMRSFIADLANAQRRVSTEYQRSEQLLGSVLPSSIARKIRDEEHTFAQRIDHGSVLFADIVGFTPLAGSLSPEELVSLLNSVFLRFDELTATHGAEKIKTIGDGYMVAAGVPQPCEDHAERLARLGLAMVDAITEFEHLDIRVGISSGPVVAGVIGQLRFSYDLWGDTVNMAARMESHGVAGRVQISAATHALLNEKFDCEARGEIDIKGAGPQSAWFLLAEK